MKSLSELTKDEKEAYDRGYNLGFRHGYRRALLSQLKTIGEDLCDLEETFYDNLRSVPE